MIFHIHNEFEYGFEMSTSILITRPVPVFWYWRKSKPILKLNQRRKTHQFRFDLADIHIYMFCYHDVWWVRLAIFKFMLVFVGSLSPYSIFNKNYGSTSYVCRRLVAPLKKNLICGSSELRSSPFKFFSISTIWRDINT